VEARTHHPLGYVEQLYTFADRDRTRDGGGPTISLSYLALTREAPPWGEPGAGWLNWYRFFPWEDWRDGAPATIRRDILPRLAEWQEEAPASERQMRAQRVAFAFGQRDKSLGERTWNEDLVLQRYELLYEAGLVEEAVRDRAGPSAGAPTSGTLLAGVLPAPGQMMVHDHRRILATGISRLRAKIKYRPVVFELMAENFTLLQLQRTVEALAGQRLHKQNFRRLVEAQGLVEETGHVLAETGGRPAKLVRFRRAVLAERAVGGTRLPLARSG
jgi:hypothetical protein